MISRALVAFCVAGIATSAIARQLIRRRLAVDVPDERRLHKVPTPRGGGLGMPWVSVATAFVVTMGFTDRSLLWTLIVVGLPNALLGSIDDLHPLRASLKFAVQFGVAAVLVALGWSATSITLVEGVQIDLVWLVASLTVLWVVWCTNTFNFMDGMDALAGGSGVIFFVAYAVLFVRMDGALDLPVFAACAGALTGFLVLNLPPARIFMGDGGSLFVGSALSIAVVVLARRGVPVAVAVLPMLTFLWDTTYTLLMRMARGEPWYRAHCRHLYQRMTLMGVSQWSTRGLYFALAACHGALAIGLLDASASAQAVGLFVGLVPLLLLTVYVEKRASTSATSSA